MDIILKKFVFLIISFFPKGIKPITTPQQNLESAKEIKIQAKIIFLNNLRGKKLSQVAVPVQCCFLLNSTVM